MLMADLVLLEDHWDRFPPIHMAAARMLPAPKNRARVRHDVKAAEARRRREEIERQMGHRKN